MHLFVHCLPSPEPKLQELRDISSPVSQCVLLFLNICLTPKLSVE